mmetsp:Transcript_28180/g.71845  ORF Transcript_28180/g.71845 Transcript_28180/m.71845 type:complete len:138 (-) Transcript_28180:528-941(-)
MRRIRLLLLAAAVTAGVSLLFIANRSPPMTKAEAAKKLVQQTIAAHKVAVFSKSYCPYCAKAKHALASILPADKFFVLEIDGRDDMDEIQDALGEITGARSVPRVFVGGQFIGGGDDTARKASNGELKQLLTAQGVL